MKKYLFLTVLFMFCITIAQAKPEIKVQLGHSSVISSVAFSPDGKFVLSGSWDKTMKLWEVSSGKEVRVFKGFP
ncbi:MAG: hypothetical protein B7C24_14340 [Bacteroidetes bacterium 4572_77]|nr:MAG: hypothetical protein B7C24_14340 [Bacteroidetes bacterium 4572_77]